MERGCLRFCPDHGMLSVDECGMMEVESDVDVAFQRVGRNEQRHD